MKTSHQQQGSNCSRELIAGILLVEQDSGTMNIHYLVLLSMVLALKHGGFKRFNG